MSPKSSSVSSCSILGAAEQHAVGAFIPADDPLPERTNTFNITGEIALCGKRGIDMYDAAVHEAGYMAMAAI